MNLGSALKGRELRLMTLTLRTTDAPLADQVTRLYASFRKFRSDRRVRRRITGGVYFLELTLGADGAKWHPHLHVIWEGNYIAHAVAKDLWYEITGDSFIVHLQALRDSREAASYVAKYASKVVSAQVWRSPPHLLEAIRALHGRRAFHVIGSWRNLALSKPPADDVDWQVLGPLHVVAERARAGDAQCREALMHLSHSIPPEPMDVPPDWQGAP